MFHMLLLATFTAGVATLTFALMMLASLLRVAYPASPVWESGAGLSDGPARSRSSASGGAPPLESSTTS
jgi:hypothetical protein